MIRQKSLDILKVHKSSGLSSKDGTSICDLVKSLIFNQNKFLASTHCTQNVIKMEICFINANLNIVTCIMLKIKPGTIVCTYIRSLKIKSVSVQNQMFTYIFKLSNQSLNIDVLHFILCKLCVD